MALLPSLIICHGFFIANNTIELLSNDVRYSSEDNIEK
jgi:hypothetical protein